MGLEGQHRHTERDVAANKSLLGSVRKVLETTSGIFNME